MEIILDARENVDSFLCFNKNIKLISTDCGCNDCWCDDDVCGYDTRTCEFCGCDES